MTEHKSVVCWGQHEDEGGLGGRDYKEEGERGAMDMFIILIMMVVS